MRYRIGLRPDVSPDRIGCDGLHLNDRFVGILGPLLLALVIAYFVRRWFIPQQLKNLQVALRSRTTSTKCTDHSNAP